MAETKAIIQTLKRLLRMRGVTYMTVADRLNLSEASVKQMFSRNRLSLDRLDKICELIGLEISDLLEEVAKQEIKLRSLSEAQETEIVSDMTLLIVAVSVISGFKFEEIVGHYRITRADCQRCLSRLAELHLIKLQAGNRYKLNVRKNFTWISGGPIQNYFHQNFRNEFFDAEFHNEHERLILASGVFSENSVKMILDKVEKLATEFGELEDIDKSVSLRDRAAHTMVIGFRQWLPVTFNERMRKR